MEYIISDGNCTVEIEGIEKTLSTIESWYDFLNYDREEPITWRETPIEACQWDIDQINQYIQEIEEEIAAQMGYKAYYGHGNYACSGAGQMGLNLSVSEKPLDTP